MGIGLNVGGFYYEIGTGDFFHSFFSTVSYHLEPDGWGTKYPNLMNNLYQGSLKWDLAAKVTEELKEVKSKLQNYKLSQVIWDVEDTSLHPPWVEGLFEKVYCFCYFYWYDRYFVNWLQYH